MEPNGIKTLSNEFQLRASTFVIISVTYVTVISDYLSTLISRLSGPSSKNGLILTGITAPGQQANGATLNILYKKGPAFESRTYNTKKIKVIDSYLTVTSKYSAFIPLSRTTSVSLVAYLMFRVLKLSV